MNVPEVQAWLNRRDDVNTKTPAGKKETIYLKHYMDIPPVTKMSASLTIAPLERKCVGALAGDAYINEGEGNPDPRTAEEMNRLEKLNDILYPAEPKQRKKNPTTMEDVRMGGNTSTIKALRSYLTKVLGVLVPDAGKEALAYVLENDRSRHTYNFGRKGDDLVNNMLRVYIITTSPDIKDLMLQQMCAVVKRTDLNTRLRAACSQLGRTHDFETIHKRKFRSASKSARKILILFPIFLYVF